MATINEILDFNFYPAVMKQAAINVIPIHLTREFEKRINKLEKITEVVGKSDFNFKEINLIPFVFNKFKTEFRKKNDHAIFEKRELKVVV